MNLLRSPTSRAVTAGLVVLVQAGAQAAFVAVAPRLPLDAGSIAPSVASALVMLLAAAVLWTLALRGVSRRALLTLLIAGFVVAASAVAAPVAIPIVVALASPFIAAGSPTAVARVTRRHPWRTLGGLVLTAVAVVLATIVAMLLGLLAPGPLGAAMAWALIGVGAVGLIAVWARWAGAATAARPVQP